MIRSERGRLERIDSIMIGRPVEVSMKENDLCPTAKACLAWVCSDGDEDEIEGVEEVDEDRMYLNIYQRGHKQDQVESGHTGSLPTHLL
jgi:hypothetical protein